MADETTTTQAPTGSETTVAPAAASPAAAPSQTAAPLYDAEYVAQLEAYARDAHDRLESLTPYEKQIKRLVEDENARTLVDQTLEAYDAQEARRNADPPEVARLRSVIKEELKPFEPIVAEREAAQKQWAESQKRELDTFYAEQRILAQTLTKERGFTQDDMGVLGSVADAMAARTGKRVGLNEALEAMGKLAAPGERALPTRSLRGDAAAVGIPSKSDTDNGAYKENFSGTLRDRLKGFNANEFISSLRSQTG